MKLQELLEELHKIEKEHPEALQMDVVLQHYDDNILDVITTKVISPEIWNGEVWL